MLALRMPGHGTVPAGLTDVVWEDWLAAVRVGVRHVREKIGPDKPMCSSATRTAARSC